MVVSTGQALSWRPRTMRSGDAVQPIRTAV